jgi:hypothetical protein
MSVVNRLRSLFCTYTLLVNSPPLPPCLLPSLPPSLPPVLAYLRREQEVQSPIVAQLWGQNAVDWREGGREGGRNVV